MPTTANKDGSEPLRSEPLFLFMALFDLLVPYPLTLLLIGRRFLLEMILSVLKSRWYQFVKLHIS